MEVAYGPTQKQGGELEEGEDLQERGESSQQKTCYRAEIQRRERHRGKLRVGNRVEAGVVKSDSRAAAPEDDMARNRKLLKMLVTLEPCV